jgi:cytochrome c553
MRNQTNTIRRRSSILSQSAARRRGRPASLIAPIAAMVLAAGAALAQTPLDANTRRVAENLAVNVCASCHGPSGASTLPKVPRIAGQQRDYIEVQLKAFRSKSRGDPDAHDYMWGIAGTLNDNVIAALADYYAAQPPAKGRTEGRDAAQIAAGERLYRAAERPTGVAACTACHGENAEGLSVFPRLAGQHAYYLGMQMEAIQARLRHSPVMHGVIRDLSIEDIQALAYYLESR